MLLKRYGDIDYVLKLPYKRAIKLIEQAQKTEEEEILFRMWLSRQPSYNEGNYETFADFYEKYRTKKIVKDTRSKDEIMREILEISPKKGVD